MDAPAVPTTLCARLKNAPCSNLRNIERKGVPDALGVQAVLPSTLDSNKPLVMSQAKQMDKERSNLPA